jgi:hypothetical protein
MDGLASRASIILIRLSLDPSPASETSAFNKNPRLQQPWRRAVSLADQRLKLLALLATQPHNVRLYRNLLPRLIASIASGGDGSEFG